MGVRAMAQTENLTAVGWGVESHSKKVWLVINANVSEDFQRIFLSNISVRILSYQW